MNEYLLLKAGVLLKVDKILKHHMTSLKEYSKNPDYSVKKSKTFIFSLASIFLFSIVSSITSYNIENLTSMAPIWSLLAILMLFLLLALIIYFDKRLNKEYERFQKIKLDKLIYKYKIYIQKELQMFSSDEVKNLSNFVKEEAIQKSKSTSINYALFSIFIAISLPLIINFTNEENRQYWLIIFIVIFFPSFFGYVLYQKTKQFFYTTKKERTLELVSILQEIYLDLLKEEKQKQLNKIESKTANANELYSIHYTANEIPPNKSTFKNSRKIKKK